ncbi:MAG: lamin tail domain-containing protein, partial [Tannerellaceae bacterium]|nr:lamin tail domain-containing protein [Tannerellaceae bacterium]
MKRFLMFWALCLLSSTFYFSYSNETNLPSWEGDLAMFSIDADGLLIFTSPKNQAGEARLWRRQEHSPSMSWELEVKLGFAPTNQNNLRMYVHASHSDTFYVQIGNNDSRISLYEKKGNGAPKLHIAGRTVLDDRSGFVAVRLTLEADQSWTLYTRLPDEPDFYCEGSVVCKDAQDDRQALLDLRFRYVKARTSVFSIRNLTVTNTPETPIDPPAQNNENAQLELLETEIINSRELIFRFDKDVDITEAICFESELGEATITGYAGSKNAVAVRTMDQMNEGMDYTFIWQGLRGADGQRIENQSWTIKYDRKAPNVPAPVPTAEPQQVIINEVMANPNGLTALPATEYVELKNNTDAPMSLQGWTFIYDGKPTLIDHCLMPPNGYAVLFREGREIYVDPAAQSVGLSKFPTALANAGKALALLDASGKEIDRFAYPAARAGVSWERSSEGYHLCTDPRGGTPGAINSMPEESLPIPEEPEDAPESLPIQITPEADIHPGDIIFNEVLPEPYTNAAEYVELFNRSEQAIALAGLSIATPKSSGGLTLYDLSDLNYIIPAGGYLVLTADRNGVLSQYRILNHEAIREHKMPKLSNSSTTLLLINARNGGQVIDELTYSSKWHSPLIKSKKGVALERIDPFSPTQDAANWTSASSTAGYGTPAYQNSQLGQLNATESISISTPAWSGNAYQIFYQLDAPAYGCRIHIYNMYGQRVAEITSIHLMGTSGSIPWDGN